MKIRLVIAVLLIICGTVILVASHTTTRTTLTAQELAQVKKSCVRCHDDIDDSEAGTIHDIHANAECIACHTGATGLKTATKAHDTLRWIGIGIVALTLIVLPLNFVVARKRLAPRKTGDGKTDA